MTLTFDDIRLREASKTALKEKLQICADLVSQLHEEVRKQFESQTKLSAEDHWHLLRDTEYFSDHVSHVCNVYVSIKFVVRKKSFLKDAIILHGDVYVKQKNYNFFRIEGPADLSIDILNQYNSYLSAKIAQIKGS